MASTLSRDQVLGDPLLWFVRRIGGMEDEQPRAAAVLTSIWVIVTAVVWFVQPALRLGGEPVDAFGSVKSLIALAWTILAVPAGLYLYFLLPGSLARLLPELIERGLIGPPRDPSAPPIEVFERRARRRLDRPIWPLAGVVLIAWYWVYVLGMVGPGSSPAVWGQTILGLIAPTPLIYAAMLTVGRLISAIAVTDDLFDRYEVRVIPLHPDGSGGFSPLGERIVVLGRGAAAFGTAILFVNVLQLTAGRVPFASPEAVLSVAMMVFLGPVVVWAWLRGAHRAMLDARARVLLDISTEFEETCRRRLPGGTDDEATAKALKDSTEILTELEQRAKTVRKAYATWPVHSRALKGLWVGVTTPLAAGLVGIGVAMIRQALGVH